MSRQDGMLLRCQWHYQNKYVCREFTKCRIRGNERRAERKRRGQRAVPRWVEACEKRKHINKRGPVRFGSKWLGCLCRTTPDSKANGSYHHHIDIRYNTASRTLCTFEWWPLLLLTYSVRISLALHRLLWPSDDTASCQLLGIPVRSTWNSCGYAMALSIITYCSTSSCQRLVPLLAPPSEHHRTTICRRLTLFSSLAVGPSARVVHFSLGWTLATKRICSSCHRDIIRCD